MLTRYIEAAMKQAHYEKIEDGTYWGNIPGFEGLWGNAETLEKCRTELKETLEDWLLVKLWLNHDNIPVVERMKLAPPRSAISREKHATAEATRHRKAS